MRLAGSTFSGSSETVLCACLPLIDDMLFIHERQEGPQGQTSREWSTMFLFDFTKPLYKDIAE